jgi:rRNA maturation endonuclease Nob1
MVAYDIRCLGCARAIRPDLCGVTGSPVPIETSRKAYNGESR